MIAPVEITPRLREWAELADFTLTPGSHTSDGRALFWSAGGEVRLFVGRNDDGWFLVTDSDRLGPEQFLLAATSMSTIERYFFGRFGRSIRSKRELPLVRIPSSRDEISDGFTIGTRFLEGLQRLALIAPDGPAVAISSGDEYSGTRELVKLSLYLTSTVDDLTASFLDIDGKPLFKRR